MFVSARFAKSARRESLLVCSSYIFYFSVCSFLHSAAGLSHNCRQAWSPAKAILKKSSPEFLTGEADMKSVKLVQIGLLAATPMLVAGAGAAFAQTGGTATQAAPAPCLASWCRVVQQRICEGGKTAR
jgi:hypothetical protein